MLKDYIRRKFASDVANFLCQAIDTKEHADLFVKLYNEWLEYQQHQIYNVQEFPSLRIRFRPHQNSVRVISNAVFLLVCHTFVIPYKDQICNPLIFGITNFPLAQINIYCRIFSRNL